MLNLPRCSAGQTTSALLKGTHDLHGHGSRSVADQHTSTRDKGGGTLCTSVCPTYWYPQHADDTQATYVHDINRHLVRRGHRVTVVAPGHPSLAPKEIFDGVEVIRFAMELPPDLTYGKVAQSRVSLLGKFARLAVMAHYTEAQYRTTVNVARERKASVIHAHWAIPTGLSAVLAPAGSGFPA